MCSFVTNLGYTIDDDGFHGSLTFQKPDTSIDDSIEWNRSYQEACTFNWADDQTKADCEAIDAHMKPIIEFYNELYTEPQYRQSQARIFTV